MIELTAAARTQLLHYLGSDERGRSRNPDDFAVRISVGEAAPPPGFELTIVAAEAPGTDRRVEADGVAVRLSPDAVGRLEAAVIDFAERDGATGFHVIPTAARPAAAPARRPPAAGSPPDEGLAARVRAELRESVNPTLQAHGGTVRLEAVSGGVARVVMEGGCQGCSAARLTLKGIVERMIRARVPGIESVEDVTDHSAGTDAYLPRRSGLATAPA